MLSRLSNEQKKVRIRIWEPYALSSNPSTWLSTGHASLQTFTGGPDGSGVYVSFWPALNDGCPCSNSGGRASKDHFHTLEEDQRYSINNKEFDIGALDYAAINAEYARRTQPGFNLKWALQPSFRLINQTMKANCSTLVYDLLVIGGFNARLSPFAQLLAALTSNIKKLANFTFQIAAVLTFGMLVMFVSDIARFIYTVKLWKYVCIGLTELAKVIRYVWPLSKYGLLAHSIGWLPAMLVVFAISLTVVSLVLLSGTFIKNFLFMTPTHIAEFMSRIDRTADLILEFQPNQSNQENPAFIAQEAGSRISVVNQFGTLVNYLVTQVSTIASSTARLVSNTFSWSYNKATRIFGFSTPNVESESRVSISSSYMPINERFRAQNCARRIEMEHADIENTVTSLHNRKGMEARCLAPAEEISNELQPELRYGP